MSDNDANRAQSLRRRHVLRAAATVTGAAVIGATTAVAVPRSTAVGSADRVTADLLSDPKSKSTAAVKDVVSAAERSLKASFARTTPTVIRIEAGVAGVKGDGQTDDRLAMQKLLDSATRGTTILIGSAGDSGVFRVDAPLVIRQGQLRIIGSGADHYSSSIQTAAPIHILEVRASGLVLDQVSMASTRTAGTPGSDGIVFLGSPRADIDAHVVRSTFFALNRAIVMRGKNLRVENSLFSNGQTGLYIGGPDGGYHDGFESRNLIAMTNRFHAMGSQPNAAGILISNEHQHRMSHIGGNVFDMQGYARHVAIEGAPGKLHTDVHLAANSHFQTLRAAYHLDQIARCTISSAHISGTASSTGAAVLVRRARQVMLSDSVVSEHETGVLVEQSAHTQIRGVTASNNRQAGIRLGAANHGLLLDGVSAYENDTWGISGQSPTGLHVGLVAAYANTRGDIEPTLRI